MKKQQWLYYLAIVIVLCTGLFLNGCASKYMKTADASAGEAYVPKSDDVVIVFLRPSSFGGAIQSSVFDASGPENKLVGIVSAKSKVAYRTTPGEHLFMVIGESADFMKADLIAGKTYYSLVTPRMGVWKARFSLKPISSAELRTDDFRDWFESCEFVENTDASIQWAQDNRQSIQEKREEYYKKWMDKSPSDRPRLNSNDGI